MIGQEKAHRGGSCDFFDQGPEIAERIARQHVQIGRDCAFGRGGGQNAVDANHHDFQKRRHHTLAQLVAPRHRMQPEGFQH